MTAGSRFAGPTGDYLTDLANGFVTTRTPGPITAAIPDIPNITKVVGWDAAHRAAISTIKTKHETWSSTGASVAMSGSGVNDCMVDSYFDQLRDMKIPLYGLYGDAWSTYYSETPQGASGWQSSPTTKWPNGAPFVFSQGGTGWSPRAMFIGLNGLPTSASPIMRMITPSSRTKNARGQTIYAAILDFIIFDPTGANGMTITLDVDGLAPGAGQMTLDGSTSGIAAGQFTLGGTNTLRRLRITGISGNNFDPVVQHIVNFNAQSNAAALSSVIIVCTYPTNDGTGKPIDAGVGFGHFAGGGGTYMHEWARQDTGAPFPLDKLALFATGTAGTTDKFPFDVTVPIMDVYDDCAIYTNNPAAAAGSSPNVSVYGLSPASYQDAHRRMLGAMRAQRLIATNGLYGISPIVVETSFPDGAVADFGSPGIPGGWREYFAKMRDLVGATGEFPGLVYDANSDFAEYGVGYGYQVPGNPHPTPKGHNREALMLGSQL